MSGGFVPYHLRTNKFIDRSIFMEYLMRLNAHRRLSNYKYTGFGSTHMEDFKLIHSVLGINDLTSIEQDEIVHNRQLYNLPLACIKPLLNTSGDYILDYEAEGNLIIWLDYASVDALGVQIREFQSMLSKAEEYDVIKITVNSNPDALCTAGTVPSAELLDRRLEKLKIRLSENMPSSVDKSMMKKKSLPRVLYKTIKLSSEKIFGAYSGMVFHPVTSFAYTDAVHQMLTVTGIVLKEENVEQMVADTQISAWEYYIGSEENPMLIDMPHFTLKEKLEIDKFLPCSTIYEIQKMLEKESLAFDPSEDKSLEKVESYAKFYRHYPHFSRVSM